MLTQLSTLKSRLELTVPDYDDLLTSTIAAVSARFEKECNRTFGEEDAFHEFAADDTELVVSHYPIRQVINFFLKSNEQEGWVVQDEIEYLIRNDCIISLPQPLGTCRQQARFEYVGGYLLPGADPDGAPPLPTDLEQACVEQCAAWFLNRDKVGLEINWPKGGIYQRFSQLPLLPSVSAILRKYERWSI